MQIKTMKLMNFKQIDNELPTYYYFLCKNNGVRVLFFSIKARNIPLYIPKLKKESAPF